jgi:hypothetical protein
MTATATPSSRPSIPWYVYVGLAGIVGVVASLLAGAAPPPPPSQGGELAVDLPMPVWGLLCLSPLLVGFGALIVRRLTEPGMGITGRMVVSVVLVLVMLLVFLYLLAAGGSHGGGSITITTGGPGHTNATRPPPTNNSTPPVNGTSVPGTYTVAVQPWELLTGVVAVSAVVGALALPGVLARLVDRPKRRVLAVGIARNQLRSALADAGAAIDRGDDPRETVVRLYVRLLSELEPRVGDVAALTPDEIRRQALAGLGVSAPAAEALTRLFEEARYSTHAIGPSEAGRFREAIRQVEHDLLRSAAT